ncbi:MAG: hypothetical protein M5U14_10950 [Acidimicrobiia bacterium]|nr:hypothetical protein [Acidimicrobiia bacterium]
MKDPGSFRPGVATGGHSARRHGSPLRAEVLRSVRERIRAGRYEPTVEEVAERLATVLCVEADRLVDA